MANFDTDIAKVARSPRINTYPNGSKVRGRKIQTRAEYTADGTEVVSDKIYVGVLEAGARIDAFTSSIFASTTTAATIDIGYEPISDKSELEASGDAFVDGLDVAAGAKTLASAAGAHIGTPVILNEPVWLVATIKAKTTLTSGTKLVLQIDQVH